jgi:hypothetical protein
LDIAESRGEKPEAVSKEGMERDGFSGMDASPFFDACVVARARTATSFSGTALDE